MTNEQLKQVITLHSQIFERIQCRAVQGRFPHRTCLFCSGHDIGYYDSQSFQHEAGCPIPLIDDMQELLREGDND